MTTKKLYRSTKDVKIAGVAGGIAEYFDVDPTLVRLIWIGLAFAQAGILAYIVCALVIPKRPESDVVIAEDAKNDGNVKDYRDFDGYNKN